MTQLFSSEVSLVSVFYSGYDNMGFQMSKPNLRAELEASLKGCVLFLYPEQNFSPLLWNFAPEQNVFFVLFISSL